MMEAVTVMAGGGFGACAQISVPFHTICGINIVCGFMGWLLFLSFLFQWVSQSCFQWDGYLPAPLDVGCPFFSELS